MAAERAYIEQFRNIQQRVIAALDTACQTRADKTDKSADIRPSSRVRLPQNPDVLRLAKMINERGSQETSQNDIALQFTEGNEKKACSLLRQLRRYPHLTFSPKR